MENRTVEEGYIQERSYIKEMIREECENFIELIDCVDDPPGLDYSVTGNGIRIRIVAEIIKYYQELK